MMEMRGEGIMDVYLRVDELIIDLEDMQRGRGGTCAKDVVDRSPYGVYFFDGVIVFKGARY
jgi:hypothetical protein